VILAVPVFWYLSAERLRLDEAWSRELAHLAKALEATLSGEIDAAKNYFQSDVPKKLSDAESNSFVKRNPYISEAGQGTLPQERKQVCAAASPAELAVWAKGEQGSLQFALDGRKIFHDVAIDDAFEYLLVAEGGWGGTDGDSTATTTEKSSEVRKDNIREQETEGAGADLEDRRGKVVVGMTHGTFSGDWSDLGFLRQQALGTANAQQPVVGLKDVRGLIDEKTQQPLNVSALARSSGRYSVRIGDEAYQLFSYPITVLRRRPGAGDCAAAEYTWIVGGLVNPLRTWREAATIAPHSTLLIVIVLLLIVALQPLVKLYFLNPAERFRFADACMLAANATLVLMATTLLLLENGAYSNIQKSANTSLETLASIVENKLIGEFRSMRAELLNFTNRFPNCDVSPKEDVKDLAVSAKEIPVSLREYPELVQVTWINPQGGQIFKVTTNPQLTPRISVRGRTYFTEASYREPWNLWSFAGEDESGESTPSFFVQSARSWTTADLSTDLSISLRNKTNLSDRTGNCDGYVAEISAPLLTAERPILADGYQFAVISANGHVLYHSDPRRTLKENLLVEIEDADALHAAIQSRTQRHLKTMYGGRPTELFIRPLDVKNSGWFVVTLRDRGWIYSAATETLFHAGALCFLAWLVSTLFLLMALLHAGKRSLPHVWPAPWKKGFYRKLTAFYAALTTAGITMVLALDPAGTFLMWFSLSFPLAVGMTALLVHRLNPRAAVRAQDATERSASSSYWPWYVAALSMLWVSAGTVPAAGIFRRSWHLELHKLEQFEQTRYVRSVNDWDAEDRDSYRGRDIAFATPEDREGLLRHRSKSRTSFTVRYARGAFTVSTLEEWLEGHLPFYSEPVESFRYQRADNGPAGGSLLADSDLSGALPASPFSILLWALFVVTGGSCFRFTLRSLFWPGVSKRAMRLPARQDERPYAVLLVPTSRQKRLLKKWFQPAAAAVEVSSGAPEQFSQPAGGSLEILDFEDAWSDTGRRQTMLERLENARDDERLVILAEADPLLALTQENPNSEQVPPSGLPAAERERWISVFRPSHTMAPSVFLEDGEDDERFHALWHNCSPAEQLTLIEVGQEGFANRHHGETVQRLLNAGLLALSPHLNLGIPGWRDFVVQQPVPTGVNRLEPHPGKPGWRTIRWIFLILLVIAIVFAFVTGASWIKSATAMMSVLGGIMETAWKILGAVHRISAPEGE
jgi:hypothetical protein